MSRFRLLMLVVCMSPGCTAMRAVDEGISGVLEKVPGAKMLGIESRKSAEKTAQTLAKSVQAEPKPVDMQALLAPRHAELQIDADTWLNPNSLQASAPVRVWVFHLSAVSKFLKAEPAALLHAPSKELGADLLLHRDVIVAPGEEVKLDWEMKPTDRLAVLVDFRSGARKAVAPWVRETSDKPEPRTWRLSLTGDAIAQLDALSPVQSTANPSRSSELDLKFSNSMTLPKSFKK